jgi:hypothetical protein
MKRLKVAKVHSYELEFDNGLKLSSFHESDCCEQHFLCFSDITIDDFDGLEFDLSKDDFFERIEGYGIALNPTIGFPVRIPGYGCNNGYYSSNLSLVITNKDGDCLKSFDIEDCQSICGL